MSKFDILNFEDSVERILRTMRTSRSGVPFTVVAGAGLSYPLVPTARQMVQEIPQWLRKREADSTHLREYRRAFWNRLKSRDSTLVLNPRHLPDENIPENIGKAYQLAMSVGLSSPELRRQYILDVIDRAGPTTNAAQLFLASILAAQDHPDWSLRVPFCRTLFTTNFDPLLQRALQLVGALYYISDRPSSLEIPVDYEYQGVHLIHSHGSLFQYRLANTESEVRQFACEQEGKLPDFLEKHGVIVVGYSGWCDVCMEALGQCAQFGHNLYWCDLHAPEDAENRLRPEAVALLKKHRANAYYVQIQGADALFQGLHLAMGIGDVPAIISNPILALEERLHCISGVKGTSGIAVPSFAATLDQNIKTLQLLSSIVNNSDADEDDWREVVRENHLLAAIQHAESGNVVASEQLLEKLLKDESRDGEERFRVMRLRAEIRADYADFGGALSDLSAALQIDGISEAQWADALLKRSEVLRELGNFVEAFDNASEVISSAKDVEHRIAGLHRRAILYSDVDEHSQSIDDLNRMIDCSDTPPDWLALAYGNRALAWGHLDEPEKSLADFEEALRIDEFDPTFASQAYLFRGQYHQQADDYDSAIDDYTRVIESPDSDRDWVLQALQSRAECKEKLGDETGAKADYSKAANANREAAADGLVALANRGACHGLAGQHQAAVDDFSTVIEEAAESGDDIEMVCRVQRASNLLPLGRYSEMLEDLNIVLAAPDVSAESKSLALGLRGLLHSAEGRPMEAIADLEQAEAGLEQFADQWWVYHFQRALAIYSARGTDAALGFLDAALSKLPPPTWEFQIQLQRAKMLMQDRSTQEALAAIRIASTLIENADPEDLTGFHYLYAVILLKNGENSEALSTIQEGLVGASGHFESELRLLEIRCLARLERSWDALSLVDKLLEGDAFPDGYKNEAVILRAQLLVKFERHQEAIQICDDLRNDSDSQIATHAVAIYAEALLKLGRNLDAREALLKAPGSDEEDVMRLLLLAISQLRMGDGSAATEAMNQCVGLATSDEDLRTIISDLKGLEAESNEFASLVSIVEHRIQNPEA